MVAHKTKSAKTAKKVKLPKPILQFTTKITGGRMVVPVKCREALNLSEGDEIVINIEDGKATFQTRLHALQEAQEWFKQFNPEGISLSDEFIKYRREEAKRE